MKNNCSLLIGILVELLMTVCVTRAALFQSFYKPIPSGDNIEGEILTQFAVRSSLNCPIWCSMKGHCDTYTYSGPKCILIQNKPDSLKFLASELIPVFKKEELTNSQNPCDSNPCQHESTCHSAEAPQKFTCVCLPDYFGELCQNKKDCGVDWCPPSDFTSRVVPIIYRNLDDDEKFEFHNRAKVGSGKVGGAAIMDRDNKEWVDLGDLSVACITLPETCGYEGAAISVWLKVDVCPTNSGIMSSMGIGTSGFSIVCLNGLIRYFLLLTTGYYSHLAQYKDTEWHHVIINYLGPSGGICIFHGDEAKGCVDTISNGGYSSGDGHVVLGRSFADRDDPEDYASGSVDELMFFNTKLSDSDIQALVKVYTN